MMPPALLATRSAASNLVLGDVFSEDLTYLEGTLFWIPLLGALVVDVRDAEARTVAFVPLKITASTMGQYEDLLSRHR
jgi:hypothetical protein